MKLHYNINDINEDDFTIYNLCEDIRCLKERTAELEQALRDAAWHLYEPGDGGSVYQDNIELADKFWKLAGDKSES